jgi:ABC-type glycerol-3-phosphate transport system substrate-binding protein
MTSTSLTRRTLLESAAMAAVTAPFVRSAHAAGKLSVGFWDHWVPGANDMLSKLCREWADKEKVELKIDFITSQGDKLMLTGAAEEQARSGHDILTMPTWYAAPKAERLVPVDDMIKALIAENGAVSPGHEYPGKVQGHWIAVPATVGSLTLPPCSRIDLFKEHVGLDLTIYSRCCRLDQQTGVDRRVE